MQSIVKKHIYCVRRFIKNNSCNFVSASSNNTKIMHNSINLFYAEPAKRYRCPDNLIELLNIGSIKKLDAYPITLGYVNMLDWTQFIIRTINYNTLPYVDFKCMLCDNVHIGNPFYYEYKYQIICHRCADSVRSVYGGMLSRVEIPNINMLDWITFMTDMSPEVHGGIFLINSNPSSIYYGKIMIGSSVDRNQLDFVVIYDSVSNLVDDIYKWLMYKEKNNLSNTFSLWCVNRNAMINIV